MFADLMLFSVATIFRHTLWVAIPLTVVAVAITFCFFFSARRQTAYRQRPRSRIEEKEQGAV